LLVKVGCCGFPYGMKKYFEQFNLVEVQKTFYNLPRLETVTSWREKAPETFEFTIKAGRQKSRLVRRNLKTMEA